MLWALDDARQDNLLVVRYPYFEQEEPMVFDEAGTYVQTDVVFRHTITHVWNHGLGEIVTALLDAGMQITALAEHDSVPWEALPGQMERTGGGEWRLADQPWRLPHSYTLQPSNAADKLATSHYKRRPASRRSGKTATRPRPPPPKPGNA
jgi:hypothetical protein